MLAMTSLDLTYGLRITQSLLPQLEVKMLRLVGHGTEAATTTPQSDAALAAAYHLGSGGRLIRARLTLHASLSLGMSESDAVCLAAVVELLHNASLVQDDLQDGDQFRRGLPAVWTKFDSNVAICTGDLMLSAAYAALGGVSNPQTVPDLLTLIHERTSRAIHGQCADLETRSQTVKDKESYEKIVVGKSGALLSLPLELALTASGNGDWAHKARLGAQAFSVAYQVADDLSDFLSDASRDSLNIVAILEASDDPGDAVVRACQFGTEHLDRATAVAQELPCGSGAVLLQLTHELRDFFDHRNSR
jgi:geranylgeranyl pyrophosphate synthase